MRYLGIDPGKSGGFAVLGGNREVLRARPMPATAADILRELRQARDLSPEPILAILEFVRSSPGMGVASAFTFGRGFGWEEMALTALGIPFDMVTPQRWQTMLGCMSGGDKNVTKARAQQLFPNFSRTFNITHAIADAMLLAEYGRRVDQQTAVGKRKGRK